MLDFDTWAAHYRRLCVAKEHAKSGEQCSAYFEALKRFPEPCVAQAVLRAIRDVSGWPKSDVLVGLAREEQRAITEAAPSCGICHGAAWVEGPPRVEPWGTFETAMRCPQCWPNAAKGAA